MTTTKWLNAFALVLAAVAIGLVGFKNYRGEKESQLLNVSYDPTREVYQKINPKFIAQYEAEAGHRVSIEQSHGGSPRQAKAVADGLPADVVTLALPSDIEGLAKRGLIAPDWKERFPHHSQPYTSTIVFVVRKTNPKHNFETNPSFGSGASAVAAVHDINAFKLNQLGEGNLKP